MKRQVAPQAPGVTRQAFARMKRIYGWLQDGMYPNCSSIARDLEVSVRTAARDLDCMRDFWQLPIGYDDTRHGFYFTQKVDRLPWVPVTEAELFALCVSGKVVELYQGMPFQKPLELAFAKLTQALDHQEKYFLENLDLGFSIRPFAPEDTDIRVLQLVTRAIADRRVFSFAYRKPGEGRAQKRRVHPYHVFNWEGRMYLRAWDAGRTGERRTFALGRMSHLEITEERFEKPKDFDPRKEFETSIGLITGTGDYRVAIEMDAWLTDVVRGRRFHPSQTVEELPGGGSRLRMRLSSLEEIERYLLSWGTRATVIEPRELRERMLNTTRELSQRYAEAGPQPTPEPLG